ncbi:uncharacterized protein LOC116196566 [Punica granatum]|uniref:Uncharacterized protein LOC116189823 n=1 Tax=Punica granatum TaxID=22663 RepID=A0A218XZL1_PUNGR|nr:uncharacterized protein LOC116189823 [Punica granatum]XP_031382214.1 uncharacterized protein LOC116196566 [Punica granatum]OWM89981.1 hypothetical protein CDL15_Pgr012618 [Punica granatum]
MVQLMTSSDSGIVDRGAAGCKEKPPVKLEISEDFTEEEHGPLSKRSKTSSSLDQQSGAGANAFPLPASEYNPLDEPSPLGLRLRKSPSLLDLIQMRLSQANSADSEVAQPDDDTSAGTKKSSAPLSMNADKMKASNFPASLLRIGKWEYKSRYEGDLVAKCYFAKHKLVWEVLEGGLKSKIEIQWSDIMALKANCPENGLSTLNVVLARQPLFFRETNPQPRKHTLWQATADFTDGQASLHRQHFLQCPQGLLSKHFEKLIQCDMRLNFLSHQPDIILDSPFFEARPGFNDPEDSKSHSFGKENDKASMSPSFFISPVAESSSLKIEQQQSLSTPSVNKAPEAPSPSSVIDSCAIEGNGSSESAGSRRLQNWDQIKVPGLHPSISMSDLVNHLGQCLNEQIASDPSSTGASECQEILQDIAQYLLSDTQSAAASDEKSLMARVNSLCCLLQKDSAVQDLPENGVDFSIDIEARTDVGGSEVDVNNRSGCNKQPMGMSRKDSLGDLLLHLPRIASLPKFLFDISEDDSENHSR